MKVIAHFAMNFNLEKCIGCHTCTVACKNLWTNREGAEYMWWNNVETKPGIGFPIRWEDQELWKGGWIKKNGKLMLKYGGKLYMLMNLFYNPHLPEMKDYYGDGDVYTFTYEDLHTTKPHRQQPVARPKSMVTDEEEIPINWNANWEDNAGGTHITGKYDVNFRKFTKEEVNALLKFKDVFFFYLPRICNHCLNPACVASCPSAAAYKREEDGIVLIDQDRCRNWRYCISACPYKKTYYNWSTGKTEKCILCYPRIEHGLPPACFHSCVGRIRSLGVLLYDMDKVEEAAKSDLENIVDNHRNLILDPFDPQVIEAAKKSGISDDWIEAAQKSPIYKIVKKWKLGLPLHPEFRTLPSLFYIPPLAPLLTTQGEKSPSDKDIFDMEKPENGELIDIDELDKMRLPIAYLSMLFGAGNEDVVKLSLQRQLAVRHYHRSIRVGDKPNTEILKRVGLTEEDANEILRALSLAFYNERFVIPNTKREKADLDPYIERGFAGFELLTPWKKKRRKSYTPQYHQKPENNDTE